MDFFVEEIMSNLNRCSDRVAVCYHGVSYTYRELDYSSNSIFEQLVACGATSGKTICVIAERCYWQIAAVIAILKLGAIYVPIDIDYPEERKKEIISDTGSNIVIDISKQIIWSRKNKSELVLNNIHKKIKISPICPQNIAYIMYTSGTSGKPKGVKITFEAIHNTLNWMACYFMLNERDVFGHKTSISFTDSIWEIYLPIAIGAKISIFPQGNAGNVKKILEWLISEQVTITQFVPSALDVFLDVIGNNCVQMERCALNWILLGGEHISYFVAEKYFCLDASFRVANTYGMTESAIYASCYVLDRKRDRARQYIATGYPIDNVCIYIVNEEQKVVHDGKIGEIVIVGKSITSGYWRDEKLSALKLRYISEIGKVAYFTGDVGYLDELGCLWYLGRNDRQVNINGQRVECEEIEKRIRDYGVEGRIEVLLYGTNLVCCTEQLIDKNEVSTYLEKYISRYMIPNEYIRVASFPYTANGKLDRTALERDVEKKLVIDKEEKIREADEWIVKLVETIIGHTLPNYYISLYDLGMDSLQLARLQIELEKKGLFVEYDNLLSCETIENLVEYIANQ